MSTVHTLGLGTDMAPVKCHPYLSRKWYDEECKFAIEEMKKAREKWLIKGRREKEEQEYYHKRKEAHKIIRNKKKTYM